jgi:hypothetical protein
MTYCTRLSIVVVAALVVSGCDWGPFGPSKSVDGNWGATGCCMGSERYELSITQQGDLIEGVVCSMGSGILGFKDVPVTGPYPTVRFDLGRRSFSGKFEADRDQIAGNLGNTPLRFNRIQTDGRCSGARQGL